MKNQYHINSKLLAASGACAAGALLFFAAPATPALAEEMPVVVQEDATAGTVNQALTSAPQTTDQTIQDPDAQTASGTSSAITVTAGTDTDTATEPAQAASAASNPAAESAVPAAPAAREVVAAAETVTEPAQPALEGDQAKVYGSGARTEKEPEVFAATRQQANNGSGQESGYVPATDPRAGELDPTQYTFSFTIPGFPKENMPPAYTTKSEDLRFVTNQEAAWLKEAPKNNEHFVTNNPVLADVGQTPLVDGTPIDAGYYYVICTEQGWFNLLNHLSGHYDDARHWHPEYDEAIHGDVYNITFGCDYSLQAVAAMGLAATYRITPAPVDVWIKGDYTGEDKTVDPAHYSITAISDDPALQEEVGTKMQAFQPECSDFALHRDPAVPHTYDVDLSDSGIRKVVAALGSNYIIRELIADDATYKLNQAGQYSPEGLDLTVM
ncbi:MBG domain-containing protein [Faecalibaculum rodentium]|nr:MBG domain-containing protein [Faecalibaculum rodentium]